jgi:rsbT co-antagonist protein RsbR
MDDSKEQKLEADLLKATLEKLVDGYISLDQIGTIREVNPATEKIFGYKAEEMVGQNIKMLMPEPDHSQHDGYLKNYLATGVAAIIGTPGREVLALRKNGTTFPMELGVNKIETKEGNIYVGILRDITEKKRDADLLKATLDSLREMSTPILVVSNRILLLPLIGSIDSHRAQMMIENVLQKIQEFEAKVIIIDIQGVPAVDSAVANHLIKITKATKLMGCNCVITGISPEVSQSLANLGIELKDILTESSLKEGLKLSYGLMGFKLKEIKDR